MNRIKRISHEVLDQYKSKFGVDFADNKKTLDEISIVRSKGLKNEIAGFITRFLRREIRDQQAKEERIAADAQIENESQEESFTKKSTEKTPQTQASSEEQPPKQSEESTEKTPQTQASTSNSSFFRRTTTKTIRIIKL
jgi:small subunit ribosomal protein S17e